MISPISEAAYSKLYLNWGLFHTAVLQFNWAAVATANACPQLPGS